MTHKPAWIKWECDHGRRWTTGKHLTDAIKKTTPPNLSAYLIECTFSGCTPGHAEHCVGETDNIHEAHAWFRDHKED